MKTTIFLDVDGVINAVSPGHPVSNTGWEEWRNVRVLGFDIHYSPELLRRLESLAARENVEIVWLTTWCDDAVNELSPKIGLEGTEWEVVGHHEYHTLEEVIGSYSTATEWWKFVAIQQYWAREDRADQQFVWIDDDLAWQRESLAWAHDLGATAMVVTPRSMHGLTNKQVSAVEEFCDR